MKFPNLTCVHMRETNEISENWVFENLVRNLWSWKQTLKKIKPLTFTGSLIAWLIVLITYEEPWLSVWNRWGTAKELKKKFKFNFPNILVVSDNPFLCHGFLSIFDKNMRPFLYPLKTSENCRWYGNVFLMFSGGIERHQ